ncbi:uncharacterized protein LOC133831052 [Humulus lupulus]|uniref:uncharacterized protein LOC133831052 n=1 Tax=Humulus lupulus TaxID=3486 RepID=UPI002B400DAE|nr:uncharacterized protein LOC133831052 [Humulus lupulus]
MDESLSKNDDKMDDVQVRRLSIIDFSSEDDSLIGFSSGSPQDSQDLRSIDLVESVGNEKLEYFGDIPEMKELVPQPSQCLEPERVKRNGKYNLRKSLAWDSAFFTSEGVLDAEELSSITGGNEGGRQMLPGIDEEVHRSTDSISTLGSDTLTLESNETNLFEDIRASIQKSSKATVTADERSKVGSGVRETKIVTALKRVELSSQPKMKPKVVCKKPSIGLQNPGRLARPVSACPQSSEFNVANKESTQSLMKRPNFQGKPIPISATLAKRASLGGSLLKMEKDGVKTAAGRGAPVSKLTCSLRNVPRPIPSSKSSSRASSTATIRETTSSFDSSASTSSVNMGKSPSNSMKRKTDTKTGNPRSLGSNPKTPSRISSINKTGPGKSHVSSQLMPFSKLSSSISPASSISDWSSESVSSLSSLQQISCSSRDSISDTCKRVSIDFDEPQSLDSESHADDHSSVGMVARPPSSKPSGLRLPSPKIGFFDGAKSTVRTHKRSGQSHPVAPSNLPKICAGSGNPSGGQIKPKKLNPERDVTSDTKADARRIFSNMKPRVSTPQEASKAATKISNALRNVESCHLTSPIVKNNTPLKHGSENKFNAKEVESGGDAGCLHDDANDLAESNAVIDAMKAEASPYDKDTGFAESNEFVDVMKAEVSLENKCSPHKDIKITTPFSGEQTAMKNGTKTDDAQRISSNMKPRVSTPQEASKAATRISNALRNVESCPTTSPKVKNNTPLKHGGENNFNSEKVESGGDDVGLYGEATSLAESNGLVDVTRAEIFLLDKDTGLVESNGIVNIMKAEVSPHSKVTGLVEGNEIVDVMKAEVSLENNCSAHKEDRKITTPISGVHTAMTNGTNAQRSSSNMKPRVSILQEVSKAATRISNALRNIESCHTTSPKVENNTSLKHGSENNFNDKEVKSDGDNVGLHGEDTAESNGVVDVMKAEVCPHDKDTGFAESNQIVDVIKAEVSPENKCSAHKDIKITTPISGLRSDLNSISSFKDLLPLSQEVVHFKNNNEDEMPHYEDQIDCLIRQVSAMNITETQEKVLGDSLSSQQNLSTDDIVCSPELPIHQEVIVCVQKEDSVISLSKPTVSLTTTNENTTGKRIPFAAKDSFCNIDESFDCSKGSVVLEGEKDGSILPFSEEHFDTEQLR